MVDQTEDEQVEALKKWWKENGRAIVVGLILGIGGIAGYWKWTEYVETRALAASLEYDRFSQLIIDSKPDDIASSSSATVTIATSYAILTSEYADTSYAALAALLYASYEYDKKNIEKAREYLAWAKDHPGHEALMHVAQIRLAKLLVSEDKLEQALGLVEQIDEPAFNSQYAEIKGDIYAKRGEPILARTSYELALTATELGGRQREFVQMKLDNLGDTASALPDSVSDSKGKPMDKMEMEKGK